MTSAIAKEEIASWNVEKLLNFAKLSEGAERYEDMAMYMKTLCEKKFADSKILEHDERNLLSVAFKNVVGAKRSCWRALEGMSPEDGTKDMVKSYMKIVERELEVVCGQVLALIKDLVSLLERAVEDEAVRGEHKMTAIYEDMVFYQKMGGDYSRYLAEFRADDEVKKSTEQHYQAAMEIAETHLRETHPTRLGLALNFSVCYYEILREPEKACQLAKTAFDAAIEKLDTLGDATYKDSTLIMQLLRDNLTLWTASEAGADAAPAQEEEPK